ncbi:hypothetical protein KL935_001580 [Ogataea polymorpha]|nr:hypothetical protein KL937_000995 [Ogataea polymorpha]KAG7902672.1 hypothetical protein KL935_001580 [Ogataea polymorpha]KAG7911340.1 hypothetical protein KL906_000661 [Ogataea polymorpha]KAG7912827.1 hypothetical protein KL907_001029 [Ogataea polymorpha]KAG7919442.1 hypothetical protein KL927_001571 [Ogataea polymorpha]
MSGMYASSPSANGPVTGGNLKQPLTADEKKFYSQIFKTLDLKHTGLLSGLSVKPLLEASNLSPPVLGEIWNIADPDNKGSLDQFGFCVAMRLIGHIQNGAVLSPELAQNVPPQLAKFNSIPVNTTGGSLPVNATGSRVSSASSVDSQQVVVPVLTPHQAASFGAMFDKAAPGGVLPGVQARDIFLKARLPTQILEKIWNLVDQKQTGQLGRPQFIVAMHLIQSFLNKSMTILPAVIPEPVWAVASNPSQPQSPLLQQASGGSIGSGSANFSAWTMSPQQKQQYGAVFDNLDKSKQGKVSGDEVAKFLMTSKLPNDTLATIWELANLDGSDSFNKQEFSIAMYLVQKKLAGFELPQETPVSLIQTSKATDSPQIHSASQVPPPLPASPSAPQQTASPSKSHMDDLLDVFGQPARVASKTAVPPVPAPRSAHAEPNSAGHGGFVPTSDFGRQLQSQQTAADESSDDDEGPEDLDHRPSRPIPPAIPGRAQKPHFDESDSQPPSLPKQPTANYEALRSVASPVIESKDASPAPSPAQFTNQPQPPASTSSTDRDVSNQLSQASVDIANFSNQINSLTIQTTNVNAKRDKAQKELARIMKVKEGIESKLSQLKTLYEREVQQVQEVEEVLIKSRNESDSLKQELALAEANYHSEQSKLQKLQLEVEETQKGNQTMKERLGVLNAESIDLNQQIESLSQKLTQSQKMLAVTTQQVATQEEENNQLRSKIDSVIQSISEIEMKHSQLLTRSAELEDEKYDLHEKHGDYSAQFAEKNLSFSTALASGAGYLAAQHEKSGDEQDNEESEEQEVPTSTLQNFDETEFSVPSAQGLRREATESVSNTTGFDSSTKSRSEPATSQTSQLDDGSQTQQQFSLPFGIPHSETSSIQNNPSQSVRGDFDLPDSPTSTIEEESAPPVLSSQILPEGTEEVPEPISSNENGESFEMVNHDDAKDLAPHYTMPGSLPGEFAQIAEKEPESNTTTETPDTTKNEAEDQDAEEDDLYSPATKPAQLATEKDSEEPSVSHETSAPGKPKPDESSDDEEFHDSISSPVKLQEDAAQAQSGDKSFNPFTAQKSDNMFDDLGLEEARPEDSFNAPQFDEFNSFDAGTHGFSFSGPSAQNAVEAGAGAGAVNDDWEQVFAGFGNDPSLQPATEHFESLPPYEPGDGFTEQPSNPEPVPSDSIYSQSQQLAIEELKGMGFDEKMAVDALQKNSWQLDLATNFLLDSA